MFLTYSQCKQQTIDCDLNYITWILGPKFFQIWPKNILIFWDCTDL